MLHSFLKQKTNTLNQTIILLFELSSIFIRINCEIVKFYECRFVMEFTLLDDLNLKVTTFFLVWCLFFVCVCTSLIVCVHYSNLEGAVMVELMHRISWNLRNWIITSWNLTYIGFDLNLVYVAYQLAMLFCVSYDECGNHISAPMAQNCIKL